MTEYPCPWTFEECIDGDFDDLVEYEIVDANGHDLFCVKQLTFSQDPITGAERGSIGREEARALAQFICDVVNKTHRRLPQ